MPRYKEYNEVRVIEKAMEQFWMNGYGATSVKMLTRKMRINKFSFYQAFESKERLLLRTMEFYTHEIFKPVLEKLRSDKDIIGYFKKILDPDDEGLFGCYILTITSETGESIPGAVNLLKEYITQLKEVLHELIQFYEPDLDAEIQNLKTQQLLALFTSVPQMRSLRSFGFCIKYVQNVLFLLNMNYLTRHAQTN